MKRLLLLWICLISLCLAFSACADKPDANTPPSTEPFVPTVGSTAHVHQFGQWITVTEATCTEAGEKTRRCACGDAETQSIEIIPHTEVVDPAVAATCQATGLTEGSHCSVCETILVAQTVTEMLSHTVAIDAAVAATCQATGLTEGSHCSVCDTVLVAQTVTEMLPHTMAIDAAVAATCQANGLTEGSHCSVCDTVLVAQAVTEMLPHTVAIDAAVAATCQTTGLTEGSHCSACETILVAQTVTEMIPHTKVIDAAVAATCQATGLTEGSHCSVCETVLVAQTVTQKLPHTEVVEGAVAVTCTKWGYSGTVRCSQCKITISSNTYFAPKGHNYQNSTCTHCGKQEIDYSNITLYASREGAALFSAMPNGAAMQKLYDEMEQTLNSFHSSPTQNATYFITNAEAGDIYTVARFDFGKHGVTLEEAQTVYAVFRKDHPIFYWMSYYLYWQGNQLIICTVPDFAKAADRTRYNQMIYEGIAEYHALADGETNSYNIALIYFNAIIENYSYAYDANGNALTEQWAHSIIGGWLYDQFVCEGYAKLFQLLLTLSDIENYFVVGNARGSHVWNLVKMDDGNWYWFDLTWADTSNIPYRYFCVTDATLFVSHTPSASNQYGLYPNATLPERATSAFADDDFPLAGQRFTVGGSTYELVSPGKVILVAGKGAEGDKFVYKGVVYHIVPQN